MVMGIILMIIIGVVLIIIKNKINDLHTMVDQKMDLINRFTQDPSDVAMSVGAKMANAAVKKMKDAISKKS
jgi:predicted Holliday junction resolvase-like endonuclease